MTPQHDVTLIDEGKTPAGLGAWMDSARLDFLNGNRRWNMGWCVGAAPVGNLRVCSVIQPSGPTSIRSAIDTAMREAGLDASSGCASSAPHAAAQKLTNDAFSSWPRDLLEKLAADLFAFIQDLGPMPRERLEQHTRYEAALRTIAEQGCASKDWQLARDTLNGK
jgi:hypothetical protein